jgi:hypothetical protein
MLVVEGQTRPSEVADWIGANGFRVLNVAGNRESKAPGDRRAGGAVPGGDLPATGGGERERPLMISSRDQAPRGGPPEMASGADQPLQSAQNMQHPIAMAMAGKNHLLSMIFCMAETRLSIVACGVAACRGRCRLPDYQITEQKDTETFRIRKFLKSETGGRGHRGGEPE